MSPISLARALRAVHRALEDCRAAEILAPLGLYSSAPLPGGDILLQCFAALSIRQASFQEPERRLISALALQSLVEPAWWARLVAGASRSSISDSLSSEVSDLCARIRVLGENLPALAGMIESGARRFRAGMQEVCVEIVSGDGETPALEQVADAIVAVNQFWSVIRDLAGSTARLHLFVCDPAEANLILAGPPDLVEELTAVLSSVEQQAVRVDMLPMAERPAVMAPQLPIVERIDRSGHADAVAMHAKVEVAVRKYMEAGAMLRTPDGDVAAAIRPEAADAGRAGGLDDLIADERSRLQPSNQPEPAKRGGARTPARGAWPSTSPPTR